MKVQGQHPLPAQALPGMDGMPLSPSYREDTIPRTFGL